MSDDAANADELRPAAVRWRRHEPGPYKDSPMVSECEPVEHPDYGPVVVVVRDDRLAASAQVRRAEPTDRERAARDEARAAGTWRGYDGPHGELIGELEPALVAANGWLGAHQTTRWWDADEARRAATAWLTGGDRVTRHLEPTSPTTKPYRPQVLGVRLCLAGWPSASQIAGDATGGAAERRAELERSHAEGGERC